MTIVCDRCGEVFHLSDDVKYMTPFDDEINNFENNAVTRCLAGSDKEIYSLGDETVVLCPSCMAKFNGWLKGKQKQLAHWENDPAGMDCDIFTCSNCGEQLCFEDQGYFPEIDYKFCPYCGAKMEEEDIKQ